MNDSAFRTRIRWNAARREGVAKLHGASVRLDSAPVLAGCPNMVEIDYVPEDGAFRIRDKHGGWRDMEKIEVAAADEYLRKAFG